MERNQINLSDEISDVFCCKKRPDYNLVIWEVKHPFSSVAIAMSCCVITHKYAYSKPV